AGVPVDAIVAAILSATWPLVPMPETMTRERPCPAPTACRMSTALTEAVSRLAARAARPLASIINTRRAAAIAGCAAGLPRVTGTTLELSFARLRPARLIRVAAGADVMGYPSGSDDKQESCQIWRIGPENAN